MNEIGAIKSFEYQKKEWPKITVIVSLILSIIVCTTAGMDSLFITLLIVLLYWLLFILFMVYRFTRKKVVAFGSEGCMKYCQKGDKIVDKTIIKYKEIGEPKFDMVDYRVNGSHQNYWFTVSFGAISFRYIYDDDDIPDKDFEYLCAHKLYRYWSKYARGQESDFKESERIAFGMLQNMINKGMGR